MANIQMSNTENFDILVVGDIMLDRYCWGTVNRISPEAPVPVVRLDSTTVTAGGAANVAANIAGLGMRPNLVGVIGNDEDGRSFDKVLADSNISNINLITLDGRSTTVKTRIMAHGQQIARIDQETAKALNTDQETTVLEKLFQLIKSARVIVISDYAKGFLTDRVLSQIIEKARSLNVPVLVDPKGKRYAKYQGATILTPNKREAADACSLDDNEENVVDRAGEMLLADLGLEALLITQGEDGMTLFEKQGSPMHMSTQARQVYDVTGAGDTVIAAMAVGLASGRSFVEAAALANSAAGLAVEKVGTTVVTKKMMTSEGITF
jgi:D-beta-D-heptose 7-phosphate kinase/D-beta-D-heptose 1-phosphate adenosyltransferase